jgi:hypothetical protein
MDAMMMNDTMGEMGMNMTDLNTTMGMDDMTDMNMTMDMDMDDMMNLTMGGDHSGHNHGAGGGGESFCTDTGGMVM